MDELIKFTLLGLGAGALYAIAAQGMVLIYRGSGVVNFAHGAMALLSAAIFVELRNEVGAPLGVAIPAAVLASAGAGFLLDRAVMRRIRRASPLSRLVVTLGFLGIIESLVVVRYGSSLRFVDQYLPDQAISIAGAVVSLDRLLLCLIAGLITALLAAVYRYTDFGRQTTAVAENTRTAAAAGINPELVSQLNWTLGAGLAGLSGILLAPLTGLQPAAMVLLINPVLAAALIGGFSSFSLTLLGGLAIGIAQSLLGFAEAGPGWSASAPFLFIIAVLTLRGRSLPLRGYITGRLPGVMGDGSGRALTILVAVALGAAILMMGEDYLAALTTTMLSAIVLLSIVVLTGFAGQVSLGQYAFAGIGALVAGRLADVYGLPFGWCILAGVAAAVPAGAVFGLPALRTRGIHLAIVTLGMGLALDALLFKNIAFTGGFAGTEVEPPRLLGWSLDSILYPRRYAWLVLALLVLVMTVVTNLRRSASGRSLLALRNNERAAAALGINLVYWKLYAFILAAVIAAAGGALAAFRYPVVRYDVGFSPFESIPAVLMTFLGGIGYAGGALVGGLLSAGGLINEVLSGLLELNEWQGFMIGAGAIAMVLSYPDGLAASRRQSTHKARVQRLAAANSGVNGHQGRRGPASSDTAARVTPLALQLDALTVRYGGVTALDDVSLRVMPGEVVGLIGPNGAGKTTLLDAVSGFVKPLAGSICFDRREMTGASVDSRVRAGLGRSFQSLELFDDLSVREHLSCAGDSRQWSTPLLDLCRSARTPLSPAGLSALNQFGLHGVLEALPGELGFGQRRLLGIARAVAAGPSILLLDEPAAGLDSEETRGLGRLIRALARDWGMAVLLVEHDMTLVMSLCDRIEVLDFGRPLAAGTPQAIGADPRVIKAYLGTEAGRGVADE